MARLLPWAILAALVLVGFLVWSLESGSSAAAVIPASVASAARRETSDLHDVELTEVLARAPRHEALAIVDDAQSDSVLRGIAPPGRIQGLVLGGYDGATPLGGARITAWHERKGHRTERNAVADERGAFAIDDLRPASWFVSVTAAGHADVLRVILLQLEGDGADVQFVLPHWRELAVRLTGADGAMADLESIGLNEQGSSSVRMCIGAPGASDAADIDRVRARRPAQRRMGAGREFPGVFKLSAYVRAGDLVYLVVGDRVAASRPIPRSNAFEFVIQVEELRAIQRPLTVRVLDATDERPVRGAEIECRLDGSTHRTLTADARGAAQWDTALPVHWDLRITADGYVPLLSRVTAANAGRVEIRLRRGWRIAGTLAPAVESESVALWRLPKGEQRLGSPQRTTAVKQGLFDFGTMDAGTYVLAVPTDAMNAWQDEEIFASEATVVVGVVDRDFPDLVVPYTAPSDSSRQFSGRELETPRR